MEILLTHTPPLGVLDTTRRGKSAGCKYLSTQLNELHACRLHIFGHIHEAHGASIKRRTVIKADGDGDGIELDLVSVNAALPEADQPIIVDLKN